MRDLVAWRSGRERLGVEAEGPLFCTETGQPLEASYVRRVLAQLGRRAAIDRAVNARALRESFASRRLADGASAEALQADLGHRRRTSTARYSRRLSPPRQSDGLGVGAELTDVLLASAHCGLVIVRAVRSPVGDVDDYTIDYVNPAAAGILRSSPERLVGNSVLDRFPNAASDGTFARWTALIAEQGRSGEEARRYEEEGGSVFRVRRAACGDSIILSFDDLTETREASAKEERRASELAALMGAADEGLLLLDSDGRISSANRAAESILGVPRGGLIGRTHFDPRWQSLREDGTPFPPEELPAAVAVATGRSLRGQVVGIGHPSGRIVWLRISAHALEASGGPPFSAAVAFTPLDEHRRSVASEAGSSQALHLAMREGGALLVRCLPDGTILGAFGDAEGLVGRSCEELAGRRFIEMVHPDDAALVRRGYLEVLGNGDDVELEHRLLHRAGPVLTVRRTLRPVRTGGETVEIQSLVRRV